MFPKGVRGVNCTKLDYHDYSPRNIFDGIGAFAVSYVEYQHAWELTYFKCPRHKADDFRIRLAAHIEDQYASITEPSRIAYLRRNRCR